MNNANEQQRFKDIKLKQTERHVEDTAIATKSATNQNQK